MPASEGPFRVVFSESIRSQLKSWVLTAAQLGIKKAFGEELAMVDAKLKQQPLSWGHPLFRYPHLNLTLFRGIHWFFIVHYAVDEARRIVYVRDFKFYPDSPFASA